MRILAIETSCDDTGIAILSAQGGPASGWEVLANVVAGQIEIHKKYGGVYPMMAKREHQRNLVPALVRLLKQAKLLKSQFPNPNFQTNPKFQTLKKILEREPELAKKLISFLTKYERPDVDLLAVTNGPGLEPCLWVGVNFARAISYFWDIPVVAVNHIESHILVNFLENPATAGSRPGRIKFPAVALVVSGGHTQIILVKGIGKYKILGETRDDAAGECFDKCAKILGLGYPGGPIISKLANQATSKPGNQQTKLPRPMMTTKDYDFSFSGLKTAVLYADRKIKNKDKKYKQKMSAEVQQAIIDVLLKKTIKAVGDFNAKTLILGGGVSANTELRKQFFNKIEKDFKGVNLIVPAPDLSTDNALMTAITGYLHRTKKVAWQKLKAEANLRIS